MACTADIVEHILNLSENEFFSADRSTLASRESRLLDTDFNGVAVNAPRQITTDRREWLPVILAMRFSGERDWKVRLKENCNLVGTNMQNGTVHFSKAFVSEKGLRSKGKNQKVPRGSKPPGLALEAAQLMVLDVRSRLPMEWNTGTWSLGVIYYDWPSNTVEVKLKGEPKGKTPPPVSPVSPAPNLRDVKALPSYLPMTKTPESPDSGVSFTVNFFEEHGRQRLSVFGGFAVPVRDFHLPRQTLVHRFKNGRQENVAAVIPATLAVLGLDWDEPLKFDWAVPVYGEPLSAGMTARGCFAIEPLAGAKTGQLSVGRYVCYMIMDGRIFGPRRFEISEVK